MKNIFLSIAICLGILIAPVSAHPPIFHKRHLRLHHPEIQLIIVDEEACKNGKLLEILKKAKKGTVIVITGAGKLIKGAVKGIIYPFQPRCPDCKLKNKDKKLGGCPPYLGPGSEFNLKPNQKKSAMTNAKAVPSVDTKLKKNNTYPLTILGTWKCHLTGKYTIHRTLPSGHCSCKCGGLYH